MVVGLEARNCLNFSATRGSKVDGDITIVSGSTEGEMTIMNYVRQKGIKDGVVKTVQKVNFVVEVETVQMV